MKIIAGISGGVDSSAAALLLKEAGHEVIGLHFCCCDTEGARAESEAAREAAEHIGIRLIERDVRALFEAEVQRNFVREYLRGRTPNPCCLCNRVVKWKTMLELMKAEGAERCATGHYAEIGCENGRYFVRRLQGNPKDQSYMLYNLSQEQLRVTLFPLGGLEKGEVRSIAADAGLRNADKPDSQDICFIENESYAEFIMRNAQRFSEGGEDLPPVSPETPGNFVDSSGQILGTHQGLLHYTVGQRKGLGIALGRRVFVREIRPLSNEVVLAEDADVYSSVIRLTHVNWQSVDFDRLSEADPEKTLQGLVRIRYAHQGEQARIRRMDGSGKEISYEVSFAAPVRAAAAGQSAVIYDGEGRIIGGGIIL